MEKADHIIDNSKASVAEGAAEDTTAGAQRIPQAGETWVHHNGTPYTVELLTNLYSDKPKFVKTVVYRGPDGRLWSRPLSDWHRSFTPDYKIWSRLNGDWLGIVQPKRIE